MNCLYYRILTKLKFCDFADFTEFKSASNGSTFVASRYSENKSRFT